MNKMNLQLFGYAEDEAIDALEELSREYDDMDVQTQISVAQLAQLNRIADVLEDINGTLIRMEGSIDQIGDCVGYVPPTPYQKEGYHVFRIAGSVDTD